MPLYGSDTPFTLKQITALCRTRGYTITQQTLPDGTREERLIRPDGSVAVIARKPSGRTRTVRTGTGEEEGAAE